MNPPPFSPSCPPVQTAPATPDRRLVYRYLLQTLLRELIFAVLPIALALWWLSTVLANMSLPSPPLLSFWTPFLLIFSFSRGWRHLRALRQAGVVLTPHMLSAFPRVTITSPLDPLSTFEVCAETLSGLSLGRALGYTGPAGFSYQPFKGRITLSSPRTLLPQRRIKIAVLGEPGQPISIEIRGAMGIDSLLVQQGEAWSAVQAVAGHLQVALQQRHNTAQLLKRKNDLERSALHAQLAALQAQVEPHFLFNTLANLKYLIRTDAALAQKMLDHLVGYLHNALPDMRCVSSTLERELALAGDYLAIMRIRMGERLSFRIEASQQARALPMPPALLISLVENAIQHGLESATRPGELVISAAVADGALRVTVADNGVGLSDAPGQGVGLANIRERLLLLYGERASLSVQAPAHGGVEAVLVLPLLPAAETGAGA